MTLKSIAYHRNGVHGAGFFVLTFNTRFAGSRHFMATVFVREDDAGEITIDEGRMAIIDLEMASKDNVTFSENSWRFEDFDAVVLAWIIEFRANQSEL